MTVQSHTHQLSERSRLARIPAWVYGVLLLLVIIPFTIVVLSMLRNGNDYPAHIKFALAFEWTGNFGRPLPHFLYHFILIALSRLLPIADAIQRLTVAALALGLLNYLALGIMCLNLIAPWLRSIRLPLRFILAIVVTLTLLLVGPINLLTWASENLYRGYITSNSFHNPTIVLAKPFALAVFLFALSAFDTKSITPGKLIIYAVLALAGTLAKPSYAIAFIPALGLVTLFRLIQRKPINWSVLLTVGLPVVGVLGWQYFFYHTEGVRGFDLAPLKVIGSFSGTLGLGWSITLSFLFPIVVYLTQWRVARRDLAVNLAWVALLVALAYYLLIAERVGWEDGNFYWGVEVGLWILFIVSLRLNVQVLLTNPRNSITFRMAMISLVIFALHVIGGMALYVVHLSPNWRDWL